jgi:hypothetical protein
MPSNEKFFLWELRTAKQTCFLINPRRGCTMIPHAPSLHPGAGNCFDFAVETSDVPAHAKNIAQATCWTCHRHYNNR